MAISNYTELQASIKAWLSRDDLDDVIPDFIALAEADFNAELRLRDMESSDSLVLSSGAASLPSDYLTWREVRISGKQPLSYMPPDAMDNMFPTGTAGTPGYFTIDGSTLRVAPVSDDTVTLSYYAKVPAIAAATTNWLLTKYPAIYLYGSLAHSAPYMGEDNRVSPWKAFYLDAVAKAENDSNDASYRRGRVRISGPTP